MSCYRYTLYEQKDGKYASTNAAGEWLGMVGDIARQVILNINNWTAFYVPGKYKKASNYKIIFN